MDVRNDRASYTVGFYKDGKAHKIRRTPPPKLHDIEAGDTVTITQKKNDDFSDGDAVKVIAINPRQPNVLTVVNEDGKKTFLNYFDVKAKNRKGKAGDELSEDEKAIAADPLGSKYLLWP